MFSEDFQITIPSLLEKIQEVEVFAEKIAQRIDFSEEEKDSLAIAVTEAVSNAIIHGNRKDKKKKVQVRFSLTDNSITVYIKDEGEGFDPEKISNPLEPENILRESGRGIFILKALMDEVEFDFSGKGTEVKMVKRRK